MKLAIGRWRMALLLAACCQLSCSIPNLESQQCAEARDTAKEFYSWYLGTDVAMRMEQRETYDRFIAPNFRPPSNSDLDPFFLSPTTPTTFKIGKCELENDTRASIQVQLYWRQQLKTEQREVYADAIKVGDKWLIDKVESR